jgi:putative resolvase
MIEHLTLSKVSKILGVTTKTLRNWDRDGKIKTERTPGGHRRIPSSEIDRLTNGNNPEDKRKITLAYCRCSTKKQEENLERQIGRVLEHCNKQGWVTELYKDIGSGLNDNRIGYKKLLKRLSGEDVKRVAIEFKDRITRHGFIIFQRFCESYGVEVLILREVEDKTFEEELSEDMLSLIASYSAKYYGRRGGKKKKNG